MGRACLEDLTSTYGSGTEYSTPIAALPSPSISSELETQSPRDDLSRISSLSEQPTSRDDLLGDELALAMADEDCPIAAAKLLANPEIEDGMASNGLGSSNSSRTEASQTSQTAKPRPGYLPSFEQLGIAAPHPDRMLPIDHVHHSNLYGLCHSSTRPSFGLTAVKSPMLHHVGVFTPPAEGGPSSWSPAIVQVSGMDSPLTDGGKGDLNVSAMDVDPSPSASPANAVQNSSLESETVETDGAAWIDGAVSVLMENLRSGSGQNDSLRVLSHALPVTSPSGHLFSKVINTIESLTPTSPATPLTWINVFHAIPGRFNLEDLPSSPPQTPGPAVGGDDYFTQKVFDSAVSIVDYQEATPITPRSPRPVVPPSSIDVSIVERYIPPTNANEFSEMFDPNGSSILVDRLVELSPRNGSLLFIYPTRSGGETFMRNYLGPVLDPILRTMVVLNGLSSDLCSSLGDMRAAHQLPEHDILRQRISNLCARLTQGNVAIQRFHGRTPCFTLSHASTQSVKLQRGVWAKEWWAKQEKTRLKDTITSRYRESMARRTITHDSQHPTPGAVLLQQLLDGVAGSKNKRNVVSDDSIEVSVFVITRSA